MNKLIARILSLFSPQEESFFGVHSASDFPRVTLWADFLRASSVIKFCMGNWNDSNILHDWRAINPDAVFVGRYIDLDINTEGGSEGWLHGKFNAIVDDYSKGEIDHDTAKSRMFELGCEYANAHVKPVQDNHLEFVYWESGPNEINYVGPFIVDYTLGFCHTMYAYGLKFLAGSQSYGRPRVPELDNGIDDWAIWKPIFEFIDVANRENGKPKEDWVGGLQLHAYGNKGSLTANPECTITRHEYLYNRHILPNYLYVPLVIGELGYATDKEGDSIPQTPQLIEQLVGLNTLFKKYWYLAGYCFWDFRAVNQDEKGSGWSAQWPDMVRALTGWKQRKIVVPADWGKPVPPPPPPPPPPEKAECVMLYPQNGWINMRTLPDLEGNVPIDRFEPGDSVILEGSDLQKVGQQDSWVFINGTQQDPCKKGWLAAWLLEKKG